MTDRYYGLTQKKQNMVLEFIELTGQQDIDLSIFFLQDAHWSLSNAANQYIGNNQQPPQQHHYIPPQPVEDYQQYLPIQDQSLQQKNLIRNQYQQIFINRKLQHQVSSSPKQKILKKNISAIQQTSQKQKLTLRDVRLIQKNKQFILHLRKTYQSNINFRFGTLQRNFYQANKRQKQLLVYVQPSNDTKWKSTIHQLLSNPQLIQLLNNKFICFGLFQNSPDSQILQKYVPFQKWPCMIIFNCKELPPKVQKVSIIQQGKALSAIYRLKQQKQQQYHQIGLVSKVSDRAAIIKQQQQQYKQIIEHIKKKQEQQQLKQKEQLKKLQDKQKFKQYMLSKLQAEDQNCTFQIIVRLINGKKIFRKFRPNSKIQSIFNFLQTQNLIFQGQGQKFDLVQSFPKISLIDKQQKLLTQVFPESFHQILYFHEI